MSGVVAGTTPDKFMRSRLLFGHKSLGLAFRSDLRVQKQKKPESWKILGCSQGFCASLLCGQDADNLLLRFHQVPAIYIKLIFTASRARKITFTESLNQDAYFCAPHQILLQLDC